MSTATIQATATETIPAFFQALAQYAASHKRGQKALAEKDEMLTARRIVKVAIQTGHVMGIARVDMPEYGLSAGEHFHLFESGYSDEQGNAYAYIVADGCSCKSYEFRCQCVHSQDASWRNLAWYQGQKWNKDDELAHVEDSLESGEFEQAAYAILVRERREKAALQPSGHVVEEFDGRSVLMRRAS